jgi:hypothetical protein
LGRGGAGASRAAEKNNAGPQPASLVRGGGRIAPCCLPAARPLCKLLQVRSMRARAQLRCQATGTRSREFSMPPSASAMPDPGRTSLSPLPLSWIPIDPSNVSNYKAGWQMVDFSFSAIIHYFYFFMVFFPRSSLAPARVMWPLGRPGRPTCWAGDGSGSRGRRTRRVSSYAGCGTARGAGDVRASPAGRPCVRALKEAVRSRSDSDGLWWCELLLNRDRDGGGHQLLAALPVRATDTFGRGGGRD